MSTEPSLFWTELAAEHQRDLERFGFEGIKRHQALRYFTFQWVWTLAPRDQQIRFLMRNTKPATWLRSASESIDLSDEAWEGIPWPKRSRWLYVWVTRLLDDYARRAVSFDIRALQEPKAGNPLPAYRNGRLISQDVSNSALEVNAMMEALNGRQPSSILEIGAGYGRLAYALLTLFPNATYTIIDIQPTRSISQWYLSQLFDPERLTFLSPEEASSLDPGSFDLGLSVSSLGEMTEAQIDGYLRLLDTVVAGGGTVYLKQLESWINAADGVDAAFAKYDFPARWQRRYWRPAPVQTMFQEAAWTIPE
ncbi:putative sugar O-methyltransferase [Solirubrobacter soli]|uniref:putative sugar O-methyltransferase n=1 Tax=Solirubrobacter soli TaxID=363832 RepID=UPI0003FF89CB|nr:putative sugar O-methyltransferase [Solirubrobacter soli]